MVEAQSHRVAAFCDWLDTLPAGTPCHSQPAFRFYADLTDVDIVAASIEMRRRAGGDNAKAEALAADLGTPADWLASALVHLSDAVDSAAEGTATVSSAALSLALAHISKLERPAHG